MAPRSSNRIPGIPWLVGGAIVVIASSPRSCSSALASGAGSPAARRRFGERRSQHPPIGGASAATSAAPGGSAAAGTCPTAQPPALPAGETRTVNITTPKGPMALKVEGTLSPIAAGNFVALASCGFYDGTPFHRTPTLQDGTPFVIQGGDPTGTGTGGPGYTIKDEPVTTPYKRGTVAMARSSAPDSVGSQFFIVLDDKDGAILGDPRPTTTRSSAT